MIPEEYRYGEWRCHLHADMSLPRRHVIAANAVIQHTPSCHRRERGNQTPTLSLPRTRLSSVHLVIAANAVIQHTPCHYRKRGYPASCLSTITSSGSVLLRSDYTNEPRTIDGTNQYQRHSVSRTCSPEIYTRLHLQALPERDI